DEVASTARSLQKTLQAFEPKLVSAAASLNETNLSSLLQQVCERGASETSDYDSARQLAWALRVIHEELKPKLTNEAAIANELKALNQLLRLDLPRGQEHDIMSQLPDALGRIAGYEPQVVKKHFRHLQGLLK